MKTTKSLLFKVVFLILAFILLSGFSKVRNSNEKKLVSQDSSAIASTPLSYPIDISATLITKVSDPKIQKELAFFVVKNYAANNLIDNAVQFIESLPDPIRLHKKELYAVAFSTYYKHNDLKALLSATKGMSLALKENIYERCIESATAINREDDVRVLFDVIKSSTIKSRNSELLFNFFLSQNKIDEAKKYLDTLLFPAQQDKAWADLSLAYARLDKQDLVKASVNNISSMATKEQLYLDLVRLFAKKNNYYLAYSYADNIEVISIREEAALVIIQELVEARRYQEAIKLSQSLTENSAREKAILFLGLSFAAQGQFDSISKALEQLETQELRTTYITEVSLKLVQENYVDEAFDLVKKLPKESQLTAYKNLAYQLGSNVDFHYSYLVIQSINDISFLNTCLAEFVVALAEAKNSDKSLIVLKSIKDLQAQESASLRIIDQQLYADKESEFKAFIKTNKSLLHYYDSKTKELLANPNKRYDFVKSLEGFSQSPKISDSDRIHATILLVAAYDAQLQTKETKATLKNLHKKLIKANTSVDFDLYKKVVTLFVHYGNTNEALQLIAAYSNKEKQLFLFDVFHINNTINKDTVADFEAFKKNY